MNVFEDEVGTQSERARTTLERQCLGDYFHLRVGFKLRLGFGPARFIAFVFVRVYVGVE